MSSTDIVGEAFVELRLACPPRVGLLEAELHGAPDRRQRVASGREVADGGAHLEVRARRAVRPRAPRSEVRAVNEQRGIAVGGPLARRFAWKMVPARIVGHDGLREEEPGRTT